MGLGGLDSRRRQGWPLAPPEGNPFPAFSSFQRHLPCSAQDPSPCAKLATLRPSGLCACHHIAFSDRLPLPPTFKDTRDYSGST